MNSLGSRMKEYYEKVYNYSLPMRMPVIIRLDGRAFHTFTKGFEKPFDKILIKWMNKTAKYLCENIQGAQIAYVQSDEISIFIHTYKKLNSQAWFNNEVQKMVSISAGMASAYFTQLLYIWNDDRIVTFDSRVFVIPEHDLCNYFIWRQKDWERNSIQMLAQNLYSQKQLQNKNTSDLNEMCFQKGYNWNNLETHLKRGTCIVKEGNEWIIDKEIPVFQKDRIYIEKHMAVEEE